MNATLVLLTSTALLAQVEAFPECDFDRMGDTVQILSISSMPTFEQVFGHTGLLFFEPHRKGDSTIYYFGHFNSTSPIKVIAEVLLSTQWYDLVVRRLDSSMKHYAKSHGRRVVLQELNLTRMQRNKLVDSLNATFKNEPDFHYNWYDNNCTTKLRDLLNEILSFQVSPQHDQLSGTSPARSVLRYSSYIWPIWFGLHWGSGRIADQEISHWDAMFLPEALRDRLRETEVQTAQGPEPLVLNECVVSYNQHKEIPTDALNRDLWLWLIGLVMAAGIWASSRTHFAMHIVAAQGVLMGIYGTAALAVGLLGTFAPFWGHHNLYFASPLHFLLTFAAIANLRKPRSMWPKYVMSGLVGLGAVGVVAALSFGLADRNIGIWGLCWVPTLAAWWSIQRGT
jgi:hypothetical protein